MQDREIIVSPMAFHAPKVVSVAHGSTILDIVNLLYPDTSVIVEIDGVPIHRDRWHLVPPVDSHVLISVPLHGGGGGGKNPLRTILTIAVIAAAAYTGQWYLATYGTTTAAGAYTAGSIAMSAGMSAGVMTAGMYLVDAVAPIKYSSSVGKRQTYEDSPTYSIGAKANRENPWGVIPVILGTHKVFPPLGAKSYTELVGSDEYLRMIFVWGYGPMKISDLKLGDTLLSSYTDVEIETREGWSTDTPLTLFPSVVQQDSIGAPLTSVGGQVVRTAKANVDELSVDVSFPRGLVEYNNQGNRVARSVTVLIQYREVGASTWINVESKTFSDLTTSAVRYGWRWKVNNTKQYEIGITRTTADTDSDRIIDDVYWTYLRSIETTYPITFPHPLAVTALRIKATDQLSGNVDNLNGIVSSYCPVWNSVAKEWGTHEITNNPAALIRHVLTGKANARARTSTQVDNDTLGEFYEFCETNGYAFNMYRDYQSSVFETCQDIASAARGSITIKDGLWSVIADTGDQALVQHITPRNSWGFSAEKRLYDHPHAFRIKFKDELNDWNDDERIVYDDGYDASNATLFESIEFPGITNPDLIWKFGRFHIAQARLRPEMYSLYMDFEHLVCRRGDKVRVSHDVPLWGSGWGRVKSLTADGGNITHITLDELVTMEAGKSYACRFRLADGGTLVLSVVTVAGETGTLELTTSVAEALGPKVGDLAMFGEADRETVELLVHSITRASDFTAQLFLVDVASDIYNADTGTIPPFDPQTSTPIDITTLAPDPPTIDGTDSGTDVSETSGGGSVSTILVYLSPPPNTVRIRGYRVRYRLIGETQWQYTSEMSALTIPISPVSDQQSYEIQAQSISVYGVESQWTTTETGASDLPLIIPPPATNIAVQATAIGPYYDYGAILITFTPPGGNVYSYSEIYASTNDITYYYVGRDGTGSFTFSGLGAIYELGDTCYIKLRSVSHFGVRASLPDVPDASILIQGTIKLAGFYAGAQFFGDAEDPDDAKILLDKGNTQIRIGDLSAPNLIMDGDYSGVPAVRSSNYVSGAFGAGFLLKPDLLEVGNIAARGIIRTSVFEHDSVSVHSGSDVTVKGGDVLAEDMSFADEAIFFIRITEAGDIRITEAGDVRITEVSGIAEITIEGNDTFEVGDILRIKEGTDDEWLEVNSIVNAPTYGVVRDLAGSYAVNNNPAWTKGASVSNYGKSGDGGIYITASDANAPNLSVFTHDGSPWNDITTHLRLGNLNGYAGYGSDIYGMAAYINADNYIKIDPTNGIRMTGSIVITSGSGIGNLSDAGALATQDLVGLSDCDTTIIEAGKIATGLVIADSIQANSITADKFISTLYGDMNQAMSYVKTVLGAGDEYEHDLTTADLAAGIHSDIDALTHSDYGLSIRIATAKKWDDDGAVWDTGAWDEPTKASGSWTSASMDLGNLKTRQMALRYTLVEENPDSTTETIKGIYSTDGTNWGTNDALDNGVWETLVIQNITGDTYKATGTLKSFRYFKIKVELSTAVTTDRIILHTMTYLGNVVNLFGFEANKAIAAGGTTISLTGFHTTPAITVTPVGPTLLLPKLTQNLSGENLVGYWAFDEGSGTVAVDGSGNGNNGTLVNGPTWVDGVVGKCLSFDGVNDYVDCGEGSGNFDFGSGDFSISLWANLTTHSETSGLITKVEGNYWYGTGFSIATPESPYSPYFRVVGTLSSMYINTGLGDSYGWSHIVCMREGDTFTVYINGTVAGTNTVAVGDINNDSALTIGKGNQGYYNGLIDEVRIYNRAITADEIKALYDHPAGDPSSVCTTVRLFNLSGNAVAGDVNITIIGN